MKKNKIIYLLIAICIMSFINLEQVSAAHNNTKLTTDAKCSKYFDIDDVLYENKSVAFNNNYDYGDLTEQHWYRPAGEDESKKGNPGWTNTADNWSVWYYTAPSGRKISSNASFKVTIYNNSNSNICTETITGFNSNEKSFKIKLNHGRKDQWVSVKATVVDGDNTSSQNFRHDIKVDAADVIFDNNYTSNLYEKGDYTLGFTLERPLFEMNVIGIDPNGWGKWGSNTTLPERLITVEVEECDSAGVELYTWNFEEMVNDAKGFTKSAYVYLPDDYKNKKITLKITFGVKKTSGKITYKSYNVTINKGVIEQDLKQQNELKDNKGNTISSDELANIFEGQKAPNVLVKGSTLKGQADKSKKITCEDNSSLVTLIRNYWDIAMILAPVALMLLIVIDFVKALISSNADSIKKATDAAVKRTISVIVLIFLPLLLSVLLSWFGIDFCL